MGKVIYVYLNDNDLSIILKLLSEKGLSTYSEDWAIVNDVRAISEGIETFYIGYNQNHFIRFSSSFYTGNQIQEAFFYIAGKEDAVLWKAFSQLKTYIRKNYILAKDKTYYIGPGIYQDWLNKKYYFPVLLQYDEFVVDEKNIEKLFDELLKDGYLVKTNYVRLRNIDVIDLNADSFIVCTKTSNLLSTVVRKKMLYYEYGSECIFAYKRKTKFVFQLDNRLRDDPSSQIVLLFEKIWQSKWVQIET